MQTNSTEWSNSSAGSEHLPYKQGVLGSNPSWTTIQIPKTPFKSNGRCFFMSKILWVAKWVATTKSLKYLQFQ